MPFAFHPSYRARVRALPRLLGRGSGGEQGRAAVRAGGRLEFHDHRPYSPGDDPRDLDWNLYLRHEQLAIKRYASHQSPEVWILLDRSASMGTPGSGKDRIAREVAGGLAYAALAGGAPVLVATVTPGGPRALARHRSPRELEALLAALERLDPPSGAAGPSAAGRLPPPPATGRLTFLVSDFLEEPLPAAACVALGRGAGRGILLHVLAGDEVHPPLKGPATLVDPEGGPPQAVDDARALVARYHVELERHLEGVARIAGAHGLAHHVVSDGAPFERAVRAALGRPRAR